jgi:hypothetical protein
MRRIALLAGVVIPLAFASQAAASTTSVTMKFNEPVSPSAKTCAVFPGGGLCGSGLVKPFGQATETIQFGAGINCPAGPGTCDLRTIYLPGGSIMSDEVFVSVANCPAEKHPIPGSPCTTDVSDTIIGGGGSFSQASGSFNGTVHSAGLSNSLKFSGSITVP